MTNNENKILKVVDKSLVDHEKRISANTGDIEKLNIYQGQETQALNELRQRLEILITRQDNQNTTLLSQFQKLREDGISSASDLKNFKIEIARDILAETEKRYGADTYDTRYASKSVENSWKKVVAWCAVVTGGAVLASIFKLVLK